MRTVEITVTNPLDERVTIVSQPSGQALVVPAASSIVKRVPADFLIGVGDMSMQTLRSWGVVIDTRPEEDQASALNTFPASADIGAYMGNHVSYGAVVSAPTTPSTVNAIRFNIGAGEIYADGVWEDVSAAADEVPTASIDLQGEAMVFPLADSTEVYAHLCVVGGSPSEKILVFGEAAAEGSGDARLLSYGQLQRAIGAYKSSAEFSAFFELSTHFLSVDGSSALTETVTNVRKVPGSSI